LAVAVPKNIKLEVLAYLKDAAERIRRQVGDHPEEAATLMEVVARLTADAAELEAELIMAGYTVADD
jgi:hypothetical protein